MILAEKDLQRLHPIVVKGFRDSSAALSAMTTGGISLLEPQLRLVPISTVPAMAGGPAAVVVGVHLGIQGDMTGHVLLLFDRDGARRLVDMLMGEVGAAPEELDDLSVSALAETGNVCGTSFLNALANETGLRVIPTTPLVITDMAGAILQSAISELPGTEDSVLVVETRFNSEVPGHFLLLPDQPSMARLMEVLEGKPWEN